MWCTLTCLCILSEKLKTFLDVQWPKRVSIKNICFTQKTKNVLIQKSVNNVQGSTVVHVESPKAIDVHPLDWILIGSICGQMRYIKVLLNIINEHFSHRRNSMRKIYLSSTISFPPSAGTDIAFRSARIYIQKAEQETRHQQACRKISENTLQYIYSMYCIYIYKTGITGNCYIYSPIILKNGLKRLKLILSFSF